MDSIYTELALYGLGLIMSFPPYLRSAMVRFPLPQQQQGPERVREGHGQSFGSWPWQKGCLMVMADPSDLGPGKNKY